MNYSDIPKGSSLKMVKFAALQNAKVTDSKASKGYDEPLKEPMEEPLEEKISVFLSCQSINILGVLVL